VSGFTGAQYITTSLIDDLSMIVLENVAVTIAPATVAHSSYNNATLVDGRDAFIQPATNIDLNDGLIRFSYKPRFASSLQTTLSQVSETYVAKWYGDANNQISLSWSGPSQLKLSYTMNGVSANSTWNTGATMQPDQFHQLEIAYTGSGSMVLSVDSTQRIELTSIPAAFSSPLTQTFWGSNESEAAQADGWYQPY
jgi:hypothetical protein